jgi:ketopantoate reductase
LTRVAVWGDGAVGTGLSVALAGVGYSVELVGPAGSGRGERHLEATGYVDGSASVLHSECTDSVRADVSIIAVKAFHLGEVSGPAARAASRIVCACNGMGLDSQWGEGWDEVERMVLTAGFDLAGRGSVRVFPGLCYVREDGEARKLFQATCLELEPVDDIELPVWAKWLVNSVINPFGALAGVSNTRLHPLGLETMMMQVFSELESLVPPSLRLDVVQSASVMMGYLTEFSDNRCSMLQDLENGRETEIEFLTGWAERKKPGSRPLARLLSDLVRARSTASPYEE